MPEAGPDYRATAIGQLDPSLCDKLDEAERQPCKDDIRKEEERQDALRAAMKGEMPSTATTSEAQ
jgi:hypothetical protein